MLSADRPPFGGRLVLKKAFSTVATSLMLVRDAQLCQS